ncbi:universal stress protein [Bauldia sp.]|uniref:universal stress protein n=1 Tax=Bauldia sp. TaxID=2575872 RepID=UPI003BAA6594
MFKNVLLAIDLSHRDTQTKAIEVARNIARTWGARLHVLTVVPEIASVMVATYFPLDFEDKARQDATAELRAFVDKAIGSDVEVESIVAYGKVYTEIIHYADETGCDLIVMASHRPELKDYLLGPNAARVVRHASQSVLVVRD